MKTIVIRVLGTGMLFMFFSGCVSRHASILVPNRSGMEAVIDEDDVDISDLDENLTETEMMIEEEGEEKLQRMPFPAEEYYRLPRVGKGTVKGSVFVKDLYNEKVLGRGTRLYLNPYTSYSEQWYEESYLGGHKLAKPDARLFNYLRFTAANEEGDFAFYGVPSGSYYLIGTVKCAQQCGFENEQNIRIAKKITIHGNQVIKEELTRPIK